MGLSRSLEKQAGIRCIRAHRNWCHSLATWTSQPVLRPRLEPAVEWSGAFLGCEANPWSANRVFVAVERCSRKRTWHVRSARPSERNRFACCSQHVCTSSVVRICAGQARIFVPRDLFPSLPSRLARARVRTAFLLVLRPRSFDVDEPWTCFTILLRPRLHPSINRSRVRVPSRRVSRNLPT